MAVMFAMAVTVFARHDDVEIERRQAAFTDAFALERPTGHRQTFQLALQRFQGQTGIDQTSQDHVAARARETIKICNTHCRAPGFSFMTNCAPQSLQRMPLVALDTGTRRRRGERAVVFAASRPFVRTRASSDRGLHVSGRSQPIARPECFPSRAAYGPSQGECDSRTS